MTRSISTVGITMVVAFLCAGCGHYPARISSSGDIFWTSSSEYLVDVVDLPLAAWPKLQKFTQLSDLSITSEMTPAYVDECLRALSRLSLPKLRALRLECSATDEGLRALTNLPSVACLDLAGPYITDDGIRQISREMPNLQNIAFTRCTSLTVAGFLSLTNASTLREVLMSVETLTQDQIERIMTKVHQVTYWGIDKPTWNLSLGPLKRLKDQRGLTVVISDGNCGQGIDEFIKSRPDRE